MNVVTTLAVYCATGLVPSLLAQPPEFRPLGATMDGYEYPFPVRYLPLAIEDHDLRMAYMDVRPAGGGAEGTVLLFHGKNFFGAYWEQTIRALRDDGYRVVVPDQIGFGKSSKPDIHYSFHLLARNTRTLLDTLGVDGVTVVGHSMGGMLATRFALMYPDVTNGLVLENPIGLEDYRIKVPYRSIETAYQSILSNTLRGLRRFHRRYYVEWKDEYDEYPVVHYRWTLSPQYPRVAWASALTYEMIYTQPVVYEFPHLRVPALLVIGQQDRTTLGRGSLPPEVLATLGQYPALGRRTAAAIPDARLVELDAVGHIPHLEAPGRFHAALGDFLRGH